ncbi:MAG: hypothetical protein KDB23_16045, partial [Planctomycetales bacterium]|nr:hypothetical protein [Planctomycetales bacterium]
MKSTFAKNRFGWPETYRISTSWALVALTTFLASTDVSRSQAQERLVATGITESTVAAYPVRGVDVQQAAKALREQFAGRSDVKIVVDQRTQRILTQGPAEVQEAVQAELAQLERAVRMNLNGDESTRVAWAPETTPPPTPTPAPSEDRLQHITWKQWVAAAQGLSQNRLVLSPSEEGNDLVAKLPSDRGTITFNINPTTGRYRLSGDPKLTAAWREAIRFVDQPNRGEATQMVATENGSPEAIRRAITLLKDAQQHGTVTRRWGADVVGIPGAPQTQLAQVQPGDFGQDVGDGGDAGDVPDTPTDGVDGGVGVDGSLIGPVQIEYVEGLGALMIRGRKADVDRVMKIIDDIERMSLDNEPSIELYELKHVNSQSMADLVTQVNSQAVAVRLGTVSITPLIKPNSLMLVGRKEGVDATLKLIEMLDKPVEPSSQFNVFRLKHLPSTDAATTVTNFFQNRGGLGPRVQALADYRTNSLIIYASPRDMTEVQKLLEEIDVTETDATSEVRVFKLNNALADELAQMLEATLRGQATTTGGQAGGGGGPGGNQNNNNAVSGRSSTLTMTTIDTLGKKIMKSGILTEVRVSADARANSLLVTAPAESMDLIAALIEQLDRLPTAEAQIKVFTIVNGDAAALVEMLDELFGQQANQQQNLPFQSATGAGESSLVPLRFSYDLRTNSIISTGTTADLGVVEAILLRLDESDVTQRRSRVYRLQNAPAQEVANAINQTLQTERQLAQQIAPDRISPFAQLDREVVVVPETVSNSLIISATPRYFEQIAELVEELDARPPMVLIQVLIAQVQLNDLHEAGVELGLQDQLLFDRGVVANNAISPGFNFNNQALGNGASAAALANSTNVAGQALGNFGVGRTNGTLGYGGLVLSASSESVNVLIRALQETRRLDVLSRPQVMTLNNQEAYVLVGARVPRITNVNQTTVGITNSTTLENVGLALRVVPRISPDGLVVMEIDAEKSELGPANEGIPISINNNGDVIRSPIINTTVAQTTVSARHGQTVILGGLITKNRSTTARQVPFLGDLPVLGNLFRFDSVSEQRTELLIIMTPYIVKKAEDTQWVNQL